MLDTSTAVEEFIVSITLHYIAIEELQINFAKLMIKKTFFDHQGSTNH